MATENAVQSFERQLQGLYQVEAMLTDEMPTLLAQASNLGLRKNLALHLAETRQQKTALRAMAKQLGLVLHDGVNTELQALLQQNESERKGLGNGEGLDAAIIAGCMRVEQFEMAAYEAILPAARQAGFTGMAARLAASYEEERQAHTKLRFLDKFFIQQSAVLGAIQR